MSKRQKLSKNPSSVTTMAMRESCELNRDRDNDEEIWVKHYSSNHQILLVGEGDFSFSCSLATRFGSASNICASSLDSYDGVVRKYKKARSNLETLKRLGASLFHGVDATKLQLNPHLNCRRFDRIIFNFPHAGFHGKETDCSIKQKHRELVFGFFHGASHMVRADGEIHVSHKNKAPFCNWKLEELASRCSLVLKQCVAFEKSEYPGYENKRGDGSRCDRPFFLGECSTFKFRVSRVAKEIYAEKVRWREMKERESKCPQAFSNKHPFDLLMHPLHAQTQFQGVSQRPVSLDLSYHNDHNLRQVQDLLVQSRQRTSPLDLRYYRELRCSQFEDASSIRATQRPASFALERNHAGFQDNLRQLDTLRYTERSSYQFHDYPFEPGHYRQEERFLECSNRYNGVSRDIYNRETQSMLTRTSFPHRYTGQSPERRPLLCQDFRGESPERRPLLCQDFRVQASQEPFFERSNRLGGVSHEIYKWEGRRSMLTSTSFPHPYTKESQERSLTRQSNLNIYHPHHW